MLQVSNKNCGIENFDLCSYLYNQLKKSKLLNLYGFIDPGQISVHSGSARARLYLIAKRLEHCYVDQLFVAPYNSG